MKRILIVLGTLALLVMVGGTLLSFAIVKMERALYVEPNREAVRSDLAKHKVALVEDFDWAKKQSLFQYAERRNDAGEYFSSLVGWKSLEQADSGSLTLRYNKRRKAIDAFLERDAKTPLSDEEKKFLASFDFAWLKEIAVFDHWSFVSAAPKSAPSLFEEPIPNVSALNQMGKLRLYQGRAQGDIASAVSEVRHLSRLFISSEILLGSALGLAHLRFIHEIAPDEAPFDEGQLDRAMRVFWASNAIWSMWIDTADRRELLKRSEGFIGRCQAFNETGRVAKWVRPLLGAKNASYYSDFDSFADAGCALERYVRGQDNPEGLSTSLTQLEIPSHLLWIPFGRELVGEMLLSVSTTALLRHYDTEM